MFFLRQQIAVMATAFIAVSLYMPHALAQDASNERDRVVEAFGFRTISPFKNRDINVDPFEYRGDPIPFNSFLVAPNITFKQEYNDNVLATENDTEGDFVTVIEPELTVQKSVGRHSFVAQIQSEIRRYWDITSENIENYQARLQGNLEAKTGLEIPIEIVYKDGHLDRRTQRRAVVSDLPDEPLRVKSFQAQTGITYRPNRLQLSLLGDYIQQRLENATRFDGTELIRDNRDLDAIRVTAQASYELPSEITPFIQLEYTDEDYINERASAISRDNQNIELVAGASFDFKGLVYGFMSAGYESRNYQDGRVDDADGLALRGRMTWEPQAKTRLSIDVSRETFEDNEIIAGLTETVLGFEIQHELQKDFFAKFATYYENEDFTDIDREDDTYGATASVVYIANSRLQVGGEYSYTTRDGTVDGLGLDNNIFMLRATLGL